MSRFTIALAFCVLPALGPGHALAAAGDPDVSFGAAGVVLTGDFPGSAPAIARAVALQTDGRLVAAGQGGTGFALARYLDDGTLDASFGSGGRVVTPFPDGGSAFAIVIQPDGKIVVAGYATLRGRPVFALARYLGDGRLDATFAQGGVQTTRIGREAGANALLLQPDGRIVAVGGARGGSFSRFAVARYLPDGRLDRGFGNGGRVVTQALQGDAFALGAALQADGRIVAAGSVAPLHGASSRVALVRYLETGRRDRSFGVRGIVTTSVGDDDANDAALAVAVQTDGSIVAAGSTWSGAQSFDFALLRYLADGSLDPSFGNAGVVRSDVSGASYDVVNALAIQGDGQIVVAGQSDDSFGGRQVVARYTTQGELDAGFGAGGFVVPAPQGTTDRLFAVALTQDGAIVVAGGTTVGFEEGQRFFVVERFLP